MARGHAAGGILTPTQYFAPLFRQWGFILVFVGSAMLTALALTYIYSEKYESYTEISLRAQEVTRFKAQQNESMGSPAPQTPFKVIGATLQDILKSDAILRDVVTTLRLDEKEPRRYEGAWYKVWYYRTKDWVKDNGKLAWQLLKYGRIIEEDDTESAIEELRDNIKVINHDSYIFRVQVRDRYPERAARITDRLSAVLAEWALQYDRQPGRSRADQLATLLGAKREEMEARRTEIEALLRENQVASVSLETERLTGNLTALQLEMSQLAGEIARARMRQEATQAKLAIKQQILSTGEAPSEPVEFIPPEDFRKLASQSVFGDVELKGLLAKRDALQASINAVSARLGKLPGIQNRLDSLKVSLAATEREYALLKDSYAEAAVRSTSPVSEVRILHRAVVPTDPVAPIKVYHVLLAGGLGVLLSIGLIYLLEFLGIQFLFAPVAQPRVSEDASANANDSGETEKTKAAANA